MPKTAIPRSLQRTKRQSATLKTDRTRGLALIAIPGIRIILARVSVSPSVAFVMAQAAGLVREAHHG